MLLLLGVGAVGDDRRPGHAEPDHAEVGRRLGARHLLEEDRLVAVRSAGAAVLLRPGQACVAGLVQLPAPVAAGLLEAAAADLVGEVRLDPRAQLRAEGGLLRRVAKIHGDDSIPSETRRLAEHAELRHVGGEPALLQPCQRAVADQRAQGRVDARAQRAPLRERDPVALAGVDPPRERPVPLGGRRARRPERGRVEDDRVAAVVVEVVRQLGRVGDQARLLRRLDPLDDRAGTRRRPLAAELEAAEPRDRGRDGSAKPWRISTA